MDYPLIQFLYFDGCSLAPRARSNLIKAIESLTTYGFYKLEEVDLMSGQTPIELKRWGSPTILLDGLDITGGKPGAACSCRIYGSEGGVPTRAEIVKALLEAQTVSAKQT